MTNRRRILPLALTTADAPSDSSLTVPGIFILGPRALPLAFVRPPLSLGLESLQVNPLVVRLLRLRSERVRLLMQLEDVRIRLGVIDDEIALAENATCWKPQTKVGWREFVSQLDREHSDGME